MKKRYKVGKRQSKQQFRSKAKVHPRNSGRDSIPRGGYRL